VVKSGYQKNIALVSYLMTLVVVCDHNCFSHICYTLKIFGGTTTTSDFFAALLFLIGTKNPTFPKQNGLINEFNCYVNKLIILMKAITFKWTLRLRCGVLYFVYEEKIAGRDSDEKLKEAKNLELPKIDQNSCEHENTGRI
jgi:hypothetical protein